MIKLLVILKKDFIELTWIKELIEANLISSSMGRIIEGSIFTLYAGILTFILQGLNSGDFSQWKATLFVLATGFAKTLVEGLLHSIRNNK